VLQHVSVNLTDSDRPEALDCTAVSAGTIANTRVAPILGRTFLSGDDVPGAPRVVLVGNILWHSRYFADPGLVGKQIRMNGENYTVIGIMPSQFALWGTQLWIPLHIDGNDRDRANRSYWIAAMLRKGVTQEQARARLAIIARQWEHEYGSQAPEYQGLRLSSEDVLAYVNRPLKEAMLVLLAAVGLLLIVTCANLANLLLARAASRHREVAVRLALGASRVRIIRQFLAESVVLSLVGGSFGLLLAWRSVPLIENLIVDYVSTEAGEFRLDLTAFVFALLLSVLIGLIYGIAPAFQATAVSLADTLKEGGRNVGATRRSQSVRNVLVVAEISLALAVLVAAGFAIRSYTGLAGSSAGFDPQDLVTSDISLPPTAYSAPRQILSFFDTLQKAMAVTPRVESAGLVSALPVRDRLDRTDFRITGRVGSFADTLGHAVYRIATPGYFAAMKIPLISGRFPNEQDRDGVQPVAVVNQTFAKRYFPGQSPVGKQIALAGRYSEQASGRPESSLPPQPIIVGVIGDVRQLREWNTEILPEIVLPYAQNATGLRSMTLVVRSLAPAEAIFDSERAVVAHLDPALPAANRQTMIRIVQDAYGTERLAVVLLAVFGAVALVLAGAGIYALLAYTVSQQSREIGIRMALGADRGAILRSVLGYGLRLATLGTGIGLLIAALLANAMAALLYHVSKADPVAFLAPAALLSGLALLACYVPARRAARVDPLVALRHE